MAYLYVTDTDSGYTVNRPQTYAKAANPTKFLQLSLSRNCNKISFKK